MLKRVAICWTCNHIQINSNTRDTAWCSKGHWTMHGVTPAAVRELQKLIDCNEYFPNEELRKGV